MLTISSMKSLIAPPFAHTPLSLYLTKASPFATNSNFCNPTTLQTLRFIHSISKPTMASPKLIVRNRSLLTKTSNSSSSSGEIHVIVGPMFAGKTTTLLRRIQAETEKGRYFMIWVCFNFSIFVLFIYCIILCDMGFGLYFCSIILLWLEKKAELWN